MTDGLSDADEGFLDRLRARAPGLRVAEAEPRHLEEPRGKWIGRPGPLALPASVDEVAAVVAQAAVDRVGIVPLGGGTGLVGGQVMAGGPLPILVSLERMRAIRGVWPEENVLIAEAGATLAEVQSAAEAVGRVFPLSYASEGTARLGGALSVNSGGLNVLRYGMARDLTLGLEAVLPDGSVMHGLKRLRKDNTGYDLRHLLIGAEGTLGIITAASLMLSPAPGERATALMAVASPEAALALLGEARARAGEMVSAFELIDGVGLDFLAETMPEVRQPLDGRPDWSVLVEIETPEGVGAQEMLLALFEAGTTAGLVRDGVLAESESQRAALWQMRESIPLANRAIGAIASHDVSLPLLEVAGFIRDAKARLMAEANMRINAFGHLGDGNLHFNLFPPKGQSKDDFADRAEALTQVVHDMVAERGGSFSAEHGVGRLKVGELERYGDPARLAAMLAIKAALDPVGIMNPGVVLGGRMMSGWRSYGKALGSARS